MTLKVVIEPSAGHEGYLEFTCKRIRMQDHDGLWCVTGRGPQGPRGHLLEGFGRTISVAANIQWLNQLKPGGHVTSDLIPQIMWVT